MDIEEVENIIKQGMKWKEEKSDKCHVSMSGIECVFIKQENAVFVITIYEEVSKK